MRYAILASAFLLAACDRPLAVDTAPPVVIAPPSEILTCPSEPLFAAPIDTATDTDAWVYAERVRTWGRICKSRLDAVRGFVEKEINQINDL